MSFAKFCPTPFGNCWQLLLWQNQLVKRQTSANNTSIIPQFLPPLDCVIDGVKIGVDQVLVRIHDRLKVFQRLGDGSVKDARVDERSREDGPLDIVDVDWVGGVIAFCLWSPDHLGL